MKKHFQLLFISLWLSLVFVVTASAFQMDEYSPLTKIELGKPFPIKVVALWSNKSAVNVMLKEIVRNQYMVTLYGSRFADKMSPELIWATNRK